MLRLLLDEHIAPTVAGGLRRRYHALSVVCMVEWQDGQFLGQPDSKCLKEALTQGLTLVTYDRRTIPALLKAWAEEGQSHGGVIFVDDKTLPPSDTGGLVRALGSLWQKAARSDWTDRVCFLCR